MQQWILEVSTSWTRIQRVGEKYGMLRFLKNKHHSFKGAYTMDSVCARINSARKSNTDPAVSPGTLKKMEDGVLPLLPPVQALLLEDLGISQQDFLTPPDIGALAKSAGIKPVLARTPRSAAKPSQPPGAPQAAQSISSTPKVVSSDPNVPLPPQIEKNVVFEKETPNAIPTPPPSDQPSKGGVTVKRVLNCIPKDGSADTLVFIFKGTDLYVYPNDGTAPAGGIHVFHADEKCSGGKRVYTPRVTTLT